MAFGNKQRRIDQLSEKVQRLEWAEPYIEDARAIHNEVAEALATPTEPLTAAEVAAQAIAHVRRRRLQEIYTTLSEQITEEQEQLIYVEVLHEVRDREGEEIRHKVDRSLRTNPDLQQQMTSKARRQLWQESKNDIFDEIKERERTHIEAEVARQKIFDQSNLEFSLTSHVNLASEMLQETYKKGDVLQISYGDCTCHKSPHRPPAYSYAEKGHGVVLWHYVTGSIRGGRHVSALRKKPSLFRLGSREASQWGEDTQDIWDTLQRDRNVQVQFYTDNVLKTDRVINQCTRAKSQVTDVTLFTPIAYAQRTQQQQN